MSFRVLKKIMVLGLCVLLFACKKSTDQDKPFQRDDVTYIPQGTLVMSVDSGILPMFLEQARPGYDHFQWNSYTFNLSNKKVIYSAKGFSWQQTDSPQVDVCKVTKNLSDQQISVLQNKFYEIPVCRIVVSEPYACPAIATSLFFVESQLWYLQAPGVLFNLTSLCDGHYHGTDFISVCDFNKVQEIGDLMSANLNDQDPIDCSPFDEPGSI